MCKTPVLLIFFNRPHTLKETFEAIRKAKPSRLYLAQDGPRPNNKKDQENLLKCREIVENIDWECEVFRLYSECNRGCGQGPFYAINWVFEKEEEAIIIEDDCVASESFFRFCDEMLERYRHDERIFLITGCNFELESKSVTSSYFFGNSGANCGWATWKRNWIKNDYYCTWMEDDLTLKNVENILQHFGKAKCQAELGTLRSTYNQLKAGVNIKHWDVQWQAIRYLNHQISIIPSCNLITNIGFGEGATHTPNKQPLDVLHNKIGTINFCFNQRYEMEFPLKHPQYVMENLEYDRAVDAQLYPGLKHRILQRLKLIK